MMIIKLNVKIILTLIICILLKKLILMVRKMKDTARNQLDLRMADWSAVRASLRGTPLHHDVMPTN